jgi:hypothetical protein
MARKKRDPQLGMSLRERTQERARQARMKAAERRKAAAQKVEAARKAETANKPSTSKSPSFGQQAASSITGGQSFKTVSEKTKKAQAAVKPQPKPQPAATASKPKPKPAQPAASKPKPAQPAASKPKPTKTTKPNPNENPDRVNKTLSNGSPNPRHPMYDGAAGFQRYNRDRAEWERKQKTSARRVNRRGRVISQ